MEILIYQYTYLKMMKNLGATSMDAVELIVAIESTTDVKIPDEAVDSIRTIGDIVNYIADHAED